MTHLTLTGYYAGDTLCGAPKSAADQSLHATYAPIELLRTGECKGYSELCPKCIGLWDEVSAESANESALETLEHAIKYVESETNADNGNDRFDAAHILIEAHQAVGPNGQIPSWERTQQGLFQ